MQRQNAMPARATILPADLAQALQQAADWPEGERIARINQLTAEATRRGYVRPFSDMSLLQELRACCARRAGVVRLEQGA